MANTAGDRPPGDTAPPEHAGPGAEARHPENGEPPENGGRPGPPRRAAARGDRDRDRDERGRARNARPRDGLGRPLPHGATGVERIPEDLVLPPAETLAYAQELLDAGRPFHAHEVLEAAWKSGPPEERELWQGLAQLAVGLTHARRGNPSGAAGLLRRATGRIAGYATNPPHGVAVAELTRYANDLAGHIDEAGLSTVDDSALMPRLQD